MFSLIITIVSIALVAGLSLATLYYGGDALSKGDASARAGQIVIQGQQLLAAADVFFADNGRWPDSVTELVARNYLKQAPAAPRAGVDAGYSLTGLALAQSSTEWVMPQAGRPTFVLEGVASETCKQVNLKTRGDNGVLRRAYTVLTSQCYGAADDALTVVVTKDRDSLVAALGADKVSAVELPSQAQVSEWFSVPAVASFQGGSKGEQSPATPAPPAPDPIFGVNNFDVLGTSEESACQAFAARMAVGCTTMSVINGGSDCKATCTDGYTASWPIGVKCPTGSVLVGSSYAWSCVVVEAGNPASCPATPAAIIGLANYSVSGTSEAEVCAAFSALMSPGCESTQVVNGATGCRATCTSGYSAEWAFQVKCPMGYKKQGSPLSWYCELEDPTTASMCAGA